MVTLASLAWLFGCSSARPPTIVSPSELGNAERPPSTSLDAAPLSARPLDSEYVEPSALGVDSPPAPAGAFGGKVPVAWVTSSPSGHWTHVCEAPNSSGHLPQAIRLTQHGQFVDGALRHVLYVGSNAQVLDEIAGADPSGRHIAYVKDAALMLLDTERGGVTPLQDADVRASQASFLPLRSVTFSDDGKHLAYLLRSKPAVVLHHLETHSQQLYPLPDGFPYRIQFAAGGRYLRVFTPLRDTNKNGRLDWLHPVRQGAAPCPSPIPTYRVWEFPGDEPDVSLLDLQSGAMETLPGFVVAAGNVVVQRDDDARLVARQPGRQPWVISSVECNGRVLHVDPRSGHVLFGCNGAWGQRREMFLRTPDARVQLGFDIAGYELDGILPTSEAIVPFYPGNQSLLFNVRSRERWPLLDGTRVLAVSGNTALVERNSELVVVHLEHDGSANVRTAPVRREPFAAVLRRGKFVAVGRHLFDLDQSLYAGRFDGAQTPLTLSHDGRALFPTRDPSPTELAAGPLAWRPAVPAL